MTQIRKTNVRRAEVDTVDEVAKTFGDVYRILREQQNEIDTLCAAAAKPHVHAAPPAETGATRKSGKESKQ